MQLGADTKHRMKVGGAVGLALGLFLFLAAWAASNKIWTIVFIPVAGLIGVAQALITPKLDDD